MVITTAEPIDPREVYERIGSNNSCSVVIRCAVVREIAADRITQEIEVHRAGDVEAELKSIADDMRSRWRLEDALIIRRLGVLRAGDVMSLVAAIAPRREQAFHACRYGVENLKNMRSTSKAGR